MFAIRFSVQALLFATVVISAVAYSIDGHSDSHLPLVASTLGIRPDDISHVIVLRSSDRDGRHQFRQSDSSHAIAKPNTESEQYLESVRDVLKIRIKMAEGSQAETLLTAAEDHRRLAAGLAVHSSWFQKESAGMGNKSLEQLQTHLGYVVRTIHLEYAVRMILGRPETTLLSISALHYLKSVRYVLELRIKMAEGSQAETLLKAAEDRWLLASLVVHSSWFQKESADMSNASLTQLLVELDAVNQKLPSNLQYRHPLLLAVNPPGVAPHSQEVDSHSQAKPPHWQTILADLAQNLNQLANTDPESMHQDGYIAAIHRAEWQLTLGHYSGGTIDPTYKILVGQMAKLCDQIVQEKKKCDQILQEKKEKEKQVRSCSFQLYDLLRRYASISQELAEHTKQLGL